MNKKKLEEGIIFNELKGSSLFFKQQEKTTGTVRSHKDIHSERIPETTVDGEKEQILEIKKVESVVTTGSPSVVPSETPSVRTPVRVKRTITRYSFEFFQDQLEHLKKFSIEQQVRGERGSMSQMVREAIDMYISKKLRTEE
jgi:hypothetical protein